MWQTRQRVIKRQARVAAQAEKDLDAVRFQHLDGGFGAGQSVGRPFACNCHSITAPEFSRLIQIVRRK